MSTTSHVCLNCGDEWQRPRTRGQRPKWCPECRRLTERRCPGCGQSKPMKFSNVYCTECWTLSQAKSASLVHAPHLRDTRNQHVVGGVWTAGACVHCGSDFVASRGGRYCSGRCRVNAAWRRRYERRGEFTIAPRDRRAIYERDGWVCQLCFEPVDPAVPTQDRMGATLDHIECQSWVLIPDHSPSNLRLAHRVCNSLRGDESRVVA